ncbi:hypothetical protein NPIL_592071 [Nephila pilipes]|uniref:Uncharacterized protein n=1 Tax=Nephila pilipes TaxID=299642 RepID=A0A8X6PTM5_NEPPI|nr:hypothetical protein NPIL_592071 [Nephila pilipes]
MMWCGCVEWVLAHASTVDAHHLRILSCFTELLQEKSSQKKVHFTSPLFENTYNCRQPFQSERVCFNDDDDDTKVDSSFSDDAVPLHHFHLGQDIYAAVTYFANAVQIHLRQYGRNDNNRLFPTKRGMTSETLRKSHRKKIYLE